MLSLLVAVALAQPAPQPSQIGPKAAAAKARLSRPLTPVNLNPTLVKRRARKAALAADNARRAAIEEYTAQVQAAQAEKHAREMLPFQLEAQRQYLQRLSEAERNAALHRMAAAAERQSGWVTPYNSALPQVPPQAPAYLQRLIP